jgi:hypothetical protein
MTVLIIILLTVLCCVVAVMAVASLMPFTVTGRANISYGACGKCALEVRWLHPWLVSWEYDAMRKRSKLTLFGSVRSGKRVNDAGTETGGSAEEKRDAPLEQAAFNVKQDGGSAVPHIEREALPGTVENLRGQPEPATGDGKKETGWRRRIFQKAKSLFSLAGDFRNRRAIHIILRWCGRTFRLLFSTACFHHLRIHGVAGTGDPAETGNMYGFLSAVGSGILGEGGNVEVRFAPEFTDERFECDGSVALRTSAARVLLPLLWSLLTFPYIRAYFLWRKIRKEIRREKRGESHAGSPR